MLAFTFSLNAVCQCTYSRTHVGLRSPALLSMCVESLIQCVKSLTQLLQLDTSMSKDCSMCADSGGVSYTVCEVSYTAFTAWRVNEQGLCPSIFTPSYSLSTSCWLTSRLCQSLSHPPASNTFSNDQLNIRLPAFNENYWVQRKRTYVCGFVK